MDVRFRTSRLKRCFERESEAYRTWGQVVGERYIRRIYTIRNTRTFAELYNYHVLNLHPLTGDRSGMYAIRLTGQWRLLISLRDDIVTIEEVSNHYDD